MCALNSHSFSPFTTHNISTLLCVQVTLFGFAIAASCQYKLLLYLYDSREKREVGKKALAITATVDWRRMSLSLFSFHSLTVIHSFYSFFGSAIKWGISFFFESTYKPHSHTLKKEERKTHHTERRRVWWLVVELEGQICTRLFCIYNCTTDRHALAYTYESIKKPQWRLLLINKAKRQGFAMRRRRNQMPFS